MVFTYTYSNAHCLANPSGPLSTEENIKGKALKIFAFHPIFALSQLAIAVLL